MTVGFDALPADERAAIQALVLARPPLTDEQLDALADYLMESRQDDDDSRLEDVRHVREGQR